MAGGESTEECEPALAVMCCGVCGYEYGLTGRQKRFGAKHCLYGHRRTEGAQQASSFDLEHCAGSR